MPLRIGLEAGRIDDREFGRVRGVRRRIDDEEISREEIVPGQLVDHADRKPVDRIGARVDILDEEFFARQRAQQIPMKRVELGRIHRPVDLAPVDLRFAGRFTDDEFVIRRTPGVLARPAGQRSLGGDDAFLAANRSLVESGSRQIPSDAIGLDAVAVEPARALNLGAHQGLLRYEGPATYVKSGDRTRGDRFSQQFPDRYGTL